MLIKYVWLMKNTCENCKHNDKEFAIKMFFTNYCKIKECQTSSVYRCKYKEKCKKARTDTLLFAIKNKCVKKWFYEFQHGHPFLLLEEADIICKARSDEKYEWMNDTEIQVLIKIRIKAMYEEKFPNAKKWSMPIF